jgi:hypothetical protein
MTDLSPQAQAVLDAYNAGFIRPVAVHHKPRIAAALRAAADQLGYGDGSGDPIINEYELLAIADELDGAND